MTCKRCGYDPSGDPSAKTADLNMGDFCSSCTAKPTRVVKTDYGKCRPHLGDFDDNDNPLKPDGTLFRPGFRICRHRDCIARSHIIGWETFEQLDRSWRKGYKETPEQIWSRLELERPTEEQLKRARGEL
jgi:hypothetical protein